MTDDEKKAAALTAEVFAETFMRLLGERMVLNVSVTPGITGSSEGTSTVLLNVALVDYGSPEKPKVISSSSASLVLRFDSSHRPVLTSQ
jgi:hypothetical protein